jgi:DNA-binding response OmpR family regulator
MSKILIADNDVQARTFCYDALTKQGFRVLTSPVNSKLQDLIKEEKPDLILFDMREAEAPGLWASKVPVVVFTAVVTPDLEKRAYQAGAIDVLSKSTGTPEFNARIARILNAKHRLFGDADTQGLKILVVDDEDEIREFLTDYFEQKGFTVLQAVNGEEALRLVAKEKPSAVLLDITMPGMDGILALKKIRELDPNVGVLMVTSHHSESLMQQALGLGAYAYVLKPFDLQYLELVVVSRIKMAGAAGA